MRTPRYVCTYVGKNSLVAQNFPHCLHTQKQYINRQGTTRHSWTLPGICLDVNAWVMNTIIRHTVHECTCTYSTSTYDCSRTCVCVHTITFHILEMVMNTDLDRPPVHTAETTYVHSQVAFSALCWEEGALSMTNCRCVSKAVSHNAHTPKYHTSKTFPY